MDLSAFPEFLRRKCAVRGVTFDGPDDFFHELVLAEVERTWDEWLGPLVHGLPDFETVIGGLRPQVALLVQPARTGSQ